MERPRGASELKFVLLKPVTVIVPGVSGSAVAVIFGLYEKLLYAFGNFFRRFKVCALFLLQVAYPAVTDKLKGARSTKMQAVLFAAGLIIPVLVSAVTAFTAAGERALDNRRAHQQTA